MGCKKRAAKRGAIVVIAEQTGDWDITYPTYFVGAYASRNAAKRALRQTAVDLELYVDEKTSIATTRYGYIGDMRVMRMRRNAYRDTGIVVIDGIVRFP